MATRAGGKVHATDYSNASATGLYDTFELGWNQQLFSVVGLPASIFPEVRRPWGMKSNDRSRCV
jgi:glycerol kinase